MLQLLRGVSEDGSCPARLVIHVDERLALDAVVALPLDGEVSVGLFDVDGFGIPIPCQGRGEPILLIEQPGIPRLRREQDKLPDRNDSSVVSGCTPSNVADLIGETEILAVLHALARSTPDGSSGGGHGTLHQAVRRSSGLRLSLLRSHCHPRLLDGYLNLKSPDSDAPRLTGLRRGLNQAGYVEGRNFVIEYRWAGCLPAGTLRLMVPRPGAAIA